MHRITTGAGHAILVDGETVPIVLSDHSASAARWSLCHLRPEIVDVPENHIVVTGILEDRTVTRGVAGKGAQPETLKVFRMTDWKLRAPFSRAVVDLSDITKTPNHEEGSTLERSDFTSSELFNPLSPAFDPSAYLQKSGNP